MFSIYGLSGPIFQGSLENLHQLQPVQRSRPVGAIRRIDDERPINAGIESSATTPSRGEQALLAYRQMLPKELDRGPLYHADQIMQQDVITLQAGDEVALAWRTLVRHRIHQAPVLESGRLVGIVSERHLLTTLNIDGGEVRDVLDKFVRDVMATPVVAATPLTDIRRIARVMLERDVDGVPIVNEQGRILGFVSRSDILNAVVTDPPLSIWR